MKKSLFKLRKFFYHHPVYHFFFGWIIWVVIMTISDSLSEGELHLEHWLSTVISGAIASVFLTYFNRLVMQQSDQKKLYED